MNLIRWGVVAALCLGAVAAHASSLSPHGRTSERKVVTIRSDHGGMIVRYALAKKKIEREKGLVRFLGRCDSACTLYLGLSSRQVCVGPHSAFGFHLPYGVARREAAVARNYMLKSYPGWVRSWIRKNGGLTSSLKTMPYSYARRFIPEC